MLPINCQLRGLSDRFAPALVLVLIVGVANALGPIFPDAAEAAGPVQSDGPSTVDAAEDIPTPAEDQLFFLINRSRADAGVRTLDWDPMASGAARAHSRDMMERDFFDYTNPEGQGAIERLRSVGMRYAYWGENLSLSRSVATSHATDMRDDPFRGNILDTRFARVGIGVSPRPDNMVLITVVFLSP